MNDILSKLAEKIKDHMLYIAANWSRMKHMGKKEVTNVQKPLASTMRIPEKGNNVSFGGENGHKALMAGSCRRTERLAGWAARRQGAAMSSLMREASASITNGLVRTAMPGSKCPLPTAAFSA